MFSKNKKTGKASADDPTEVDVNDAIRARTRLIELSKSVESKDDKKIFELSAKLITTLITIYTKWRSSKKTIKKLLKMLFGNQSEKTKDKSIKKKNDKEGNQDIGDSEGTNNKEDAPPSSNDKDDQIDKSKGTNKNKNDDKKNKKREGGGGKNPASSYTGAIDITCKLYEDHRSGQVCPKCGKGKLFDIEPEVSIRLFGAPPVSAFRFTQEKTRCICGAIFLGEVPIEHKKTFDDDKYSSSALASMTVCKNTLGVSFGSLEAYQAMCGIPLPASTQANKIKNRVVPLLSLIAKELKFLGANSYVIAFDDTTIRLLEKRLSTKNTMTNQGYGTAIICDGFDQLSNTIILYDFDYSKHGGKVIFELLKKRVKEEPALLASDGLPSYKKYKKDGIDINCNVHARRKVVDEDPDKVMAITIMILFSYQMIYKNEKYCKKNKLTDIERMDYHKEHSAYHFECIKAVFLIVMGRPDQIAEGIYRKKFNIPDSIIPVEPNEDLYTVAKYYIDRHHALTKVMELPGVPLDTNHVERAIKKIIKLRKLSLFFNNSNSAEYTGDVLSVIETDRANKGNPQKYITYLLDHEEEVKTNPRDYLPWLYDKSKEYKKWYWEKIESEYKSKCSPKIDSNFSEYQVG